MGLNKERERLGITIEDMADFIGMSYLDLAKIFKGEMACPTNKREIIEFFLVKNYTKRIERMKF